MARFNIVIDKAKSQVKQFQIILKQIEYYNINLLDNLLQIEIPIKNKESFSINLFDKVKNINLYVKELKVRMYLKLKSMLSIVSQIKLLSNKSLSIIDQSSLTNIAKLLSNKILSIIDQSSLTNIAKLLSNKILSITKIKVKLSSSKVLVLINKIADIEKNIIISSSSKVCFNLLKGFQIVHRFKIEPKEYHFLHLIDSFLLNELDSKTLHQLDCSKLIISSLKHYIIKHTFKFTSNVKGLSYKIIQFTNNIKIYSSSILAIIIKIIKLKSVKLSTNVSLTLRLAKHTMVQNKVKVLNQLQVFLIYIVNVGRHAMSILSSAVAFINIFAVLNYNQSLISTIKATITRFRYLYDMDNDTLSTIDSLSVFDLEHITI